jgi:hypothetical protein
MPCWKFCRPIQYLNVVQRFSLVAKPRSTTSMGYKVIKDKLTQAILISGEFGLPALKLINPYPEMHPGCCGPPVRGANKRTSFVQAVAQTGNRQHPIRLALDPINKDLYRDLTK